jgi:predicted membrane metal-binding protein
VTQREGRMDYWFKPRRYGHGASPTTWQGWATIIAFPVICAAVALALFAWLPPIASVVLFTIFMAAALFAFIAFVRKKTDGEWRWSWGNRP